MGLPYFSPTTQLPVKMVRLLVHKEMNLCASPTEMGIVSLILRLLLLLFTIYYVHTMYIYTVQDNCVDVYNPDQSDMDRDGVGGACDNCLQAPNPEQRNSDDDIAGNVCDPDDDNDGRGMFYSCIIGALLTTHTTIFQLTSMTTVNMYRISIKRTATMMVLGTLVTIVPLNTTAIRQTLMKME